MKENLLVFFGGESPEHDVSILTSNLVLNAIDKNFYNVVPIYVSKKGKYYTGEKLFNIENYENLNLKQLKQVGLISGSKYLHKKTMFGYKKNLLANSALICMHGANGEDGKVMAMLDLCKIGYGASNYLSSGICMDKDVFKQFLTANKIDNVLGESVFEHDYNQNPDKVINELIKKIKLPIIIKPACGGSSIGISVCKNRSELESGLRLGFELGSKVLAEKYLSNFEEYNIAILGVENKLTISNIEQVLRHDDFLNFEQKYLESGGSLEMVKRVNPDLSVDIKNKIINYASTVFKKLNLLGVVRFDFIVHDKNVYLNEVNTIPGSMAYYLFKEQDISLSTLINKILMFSYENFDKNSKKINYFNSSILKSSNLIKK